MCLVWIEEASEDTARREEESFCTDFYSFFFFPAPLSVTGPQPEQAGDARRKQVTCKQE